MVSRKKTGLSNARNKTVELSNDSEFCLFVDDDQKIDKNCLLELLKHKKNMTQMLYTAPIHQYMILPLQIILIIFLKQNLKKSMIIKFVLLLLIAL